MNLILISDTHFYHKEELEEKQNEFWKRYNTIKEEFILYILGDLSFKNDKETLKGIFSKFRKNINCKSIVMIKGNHDLNMYKYLDNNIVFVDELKMNYKGINYILSHLPKHKDELKNSINIHGHLHYNENSHRLNEFELVENHHLIEQLEIYNINTIHKKYEKNISRENRIKNRVAEHYEYLEKNFDYEIVGVFLQGSQNYGLDIYTDEYASDIDTKAIILPKMEDVIQNKKPISQTIVLANDEHIDVKDIRLMFNCFEKQNINFIEILYTNYYKYNKKYIRFVTDLRSNSDIIAGMNKLQAIKCMAGMSKEKLKALQHPYPTTIDKINKFGYDPKQLHHIIRLNEFMKRYISCDNYKDILISNQREYLIDIKKGKLTEHEAVELAKKVDEETYNIYKEFEENADNEINTESKEKLDNIKKEIIQTYWKGQLYI